MALRNTEVVWNVADAASFSVVPAAAGILGHRPPHVMYGVVAAGCALKSLHKLALQITGADAESAERAFALSLAVLVHETAEALQRSASFFWTAGGYQADGTLKTLRFASGASPGPTQRTLVLEVEVELRLERLVGDDDGRATEAIPLPGRSPGQGRRHPPCSAVLSC